MSLKIIGTGIGIPQKSVSNDDLALIVDTSDEWITSKTGIKNRHICVDETLTDLSVRAATQAIDKAKLTADDIDLVICSTISGDYRTPSLAFCLSERIRTKCPAFDLNAACTGFLYALDIASLYIKQNKAKNILIVCAEMMSRNVDWNDRSTCVLFGDGAAACVVTQGNALRYMRLVGDANIKILNLPLGTGNSPFMQEQKNDGFLHMEGQEVYKYATGIVESEIKLSLDESKLSLDDIDFFILHQANKRIIDTVIAKLKQPKMKFPINIDRYGNLSSVSIPLLLHEMLTDGKLKAGNRICVTAFGAGMTAGSCIMIWE